MRTWYRKAMQQRQPDPFFEQLKADLQEGVNELDRSESIAAEDVWTDLYSRVDDIEKSQPPR